jgi:hypothetical protein
MDKFRSWPISHICCNEAVLIYVLVPGMLYEYETVWRSVPSHIHGPTFYDAVDFSMQERHITKNWRPASVASNKYRFGGSNWQEYRDTCER